MGNGSGFQFDAIAADFRIIEGTQDAPPFGRGFSLVPADSSSQLSISFSGELGRPSMDNDPNLVFSERYEKRHILDTEGRTIGEDYWGYLDHEKIWRRIHLQGFVYANYSGANAKDAEHFDQVLNSACLLSVND